MLIGYWLVVFGYCVYVLPLCFGCLFGCFYDDFDCFISGGCCAIVVGLLYGGCCVLCFDVWGYGLIVLFASMMFFAQVNLVNVCCWIGLLVQVVDCCDFVLCCMIDCVCVLGFGYSLIVLLLAIRACLYGFAYWYYSLAQLFVLVCCVRIWIQVVGVLIGFDCGLIYIVTLVGL